jgi:hypothetical protein
VNSSTSPGELSSSKSLACVDLHRECSKDRSKERVPQLVYLCTPSHGKGTVLVEVRARERVRVQTLDRHVRSYRNPPAYRRALPVSLCRTPSLSVLATR